MSGLPFISYVLDLMAKLEDQRKINEAVAKQCDSSDGVMTEDDDCRIIEGGQNGDKPQGSKRPLDHGGQVEVRGSTGQKIVSIPASKTSLTSSSPDEIVDLLSSSRLSISIVSPVTSLSPKEQLKTYSVTPPLPPSSSNWSGMLVWTHYDMVSVGLQCQILPGENETWPRNLNLQLFPKSIVHSCGRPSLSGVTGMPVLFVNEHSFHITKLKELMTSGYAGCIFYSDPALTAFLVLYSKNFGNFFAFVPKSTQDFADRFLEVTRELIKELPK